MLESELIAKMQTMLADTAKGLATKEELKKSVNDLVDEAMKAPAADMTTVKSSITTLADEIKAVRANRFAAIKNSDGEYNGIFGNVQTAKAFGLMILSDVFKNADAEKSFNALGIERRAILSDGKIGKAATGTTVTGGGALVPTDFIPRLIVLMEQYGVFRRNTQEWPMAQDSGLAPMQTSDVTVYCPAAGVAPTASQPGFRNVGLQAQKWMTLTALDRELTEDSAIAIAEVIGRSITRAFAKQEDQVAFNGDGTSTYFGRQGIINLLLGVNATVANIKGLQVQGTAGAWSAITISDLLGVAGILPAYADDADAAWYCHKAFYFSVMLKCALAAGGATAAEVINTGYTQRPSFLGRRVEFTQVMLAAKPSADHIPLLLGNLRLSSYIGDRRALSIEQSTDVYFATDQIGIRGTERIAPTVFGQGDTTNAGPIVGLYADIA